MRKRKDRLRSEETPEDEETCNETGKGGKGFFACYLLCSLSPRFKGQTYIGFTVNPRRRIRQHNGAVTSGAWRTKRKRPWEMVLCIYGFPTNVSALQFEWAWQHPKKSLAVRKAAAEFKSLSGIANKIKLVYTMLNLPAWESLNLTVNFFSTKYLTHSAGWPSLPVHMKVQVCSMDELPCYIGGGQILEDNEDVQEAENDYDDGPITELGIKDHNFAEYRYGIEMTAAHVQTRRMEDDNCFGMPEGPLTPKRDHRVPGFAGECCITSSLGTKETLEDRDIFEETEKGDSKLGQQGELQTTEVTGNDQPPSTDGLLSSPEVEIINLSTPTPDRIIHSYRRKRKFRVVPKIIDLTESPNFIQL
ncbi:structure-specific endonuclease subunit slx1-like [Telopea speciosissima]|uniref:structure-specific endonuclease subunit slx1-like n=1 Tax=Telopea speciosissima TaxID=54955 RepID=UPI001CC82550|nr:structure-specific endonuclease subunit slx1-like [Telopea speciosissima]